MHKSFLPALALGLAALCCAPPSRAVESYDACTGFIDSLPATISTQGVWCLHGDIATAITSGNGIDITANNVTIACNGFKVGGLAGGVGSTASGIHSTKLNTRVVGCHLRGFRTAVDILADGSLVQDSIIEAAVINGVALEGDGHVVRRNRFIDIGGATFQTQAISVLGSATVYENLIDGVSSTNSSVIGVLSGGGTLVMYDNTIQGLVVNPIWGDSYGVLAGEGRLILERNRVDVQVGDTPVSCGGLSVVRDNSFIGFTAPMSGCNDSGGNVFVAPDA